jgi:hypothetical protein
VRALLSRQRLWLALNRSTASAWQAQSRSVGRLDQDGILPPHNPLRLLGRLTVTQDTDATSQAGLTAEPSGHILGAADELCSPTRTERTESTHLTGKKEGQG